MQPNSLDPNLQNDNPVHVPGPSPTPSPTLTPTPTPVVSPSFETLPLPAAQPQVIGGYAQPVSQPAPVVSYQAAGTAVPIAAPSSPVDWSAASGSSDHQTLFERIGLGLGIFALVLYLILSFANFSPSKSVMYLILAMFVALGVGGIVLGVLSQKGRDKTSIMGICTISLGICVCVISILIAGLYIDFESSFGSSSSSTSSSSSSTDDYNNNFSIDNTQ